MRVKVGDKVYDGKDEPVMVILTPLDKRNIEDMEPSADRYCCAPDSMDTDEIKRWMRET